MQYSRSDVQQVTILTNKVFTPHLPYSNIFLLHFSPVSVNNNFNLPTTQVKILGETQDASVCFKSTSNPVSALMSFLQEYICNLTTSCLSTTPSTLVQSYASWPGLWQQPTWSASIFLCPLGIIFTQQPEGLNV